MQGTPLIKLICPCCGQFGIRLLMPGQRFACPSCVLCWDACWVELPIDPVTGQAVVD